MKQKKLLFLLLFVIIVLGAIIAYKKVWGTEDNTISVDPYKKPTFEDEYDVIVIGGEPEGVAAAVAAARSGSKTLLVEHRDGLGGLMTFGELNFLDISYDQKGKFANEGIFKEWHQLVDEKIGFDIDDAKNAFLKLVQDEKNLTLALETKVASVIREENTLVGIEIEDDKNNVKQIKAKRFVDSTQDADIAVMSGAPYFVGGGDIGVEDKKMAVTLMIHLKDVDWNSVKKAAKDGLYGGADIKGNVAWGFTELHDEYPPKFENTRLRGLNIMQEKNGDVYINALQIFGIDGLDEASKQKAIDLGKKETEHVLAFLKENFPGFEKASIADFPTELYVRETRHIKAEYQLPMSDVWENRDHWDSIGFGSYPVDVQATSPNDYGYVLSRPTQYAIPLRSLIPLEVDGLLVASKASGYSSLAAGSARIIPTGMTTGQAAGVASSLSIKHDVSFKKMSEDKEVIAELQEQLKEQGARIYAFEIPYSYEGEWFYPAVRTLVNYGLVVGGYDNTLPVDDPFKEISIFGLINGIQQRAYPDDFESRKDQLAGIYGMIESDTTVLTRDKAAEMMLALFGVSVQGEEAWKMLQEKNILDDVILEKITSNRELKGNEAYYLVHLLHEGYDKLK